MPYQNIRDALSARLKNINGIGQVHTYFRWTNEETQGSTFANIFESSNIINAWIICRDSFKEQTSQVEDNHVVRIHEVKIHGFYGLKDSAKSELIFQDLLEKIELDLKNGDKTLGGACLTYSQPKITNISLVKLGNRAVDCHTATIEAYCQEIL